MLIKVWFLRCFLQGAFSDDNDDDTVVYNG